MGDHAAHEDEAGQLTGAALFEAPVRFIAGAATIESLPRATLPEIAFIGRSNVGKSSLINALTRRKALARISKTPGRTQQINFFDLGGRLILADLPGYGFAQVAKSARRDWRDLASAYLAGRSTLRRALVLVDARRGVQAIDEEAFEALDRAAVSYQLVLTKIDTLTQGELEAVLAASATTMAKHLAAHPTIAPTSAESGAGIEALREDLATLAGAADAR